MSIKRLSRKSNTDALIRHIFITYPAANIEDIGEWLSKENVPTEFLSFGTDFCPGSPVIQFVDYPSSGCTPFVFDQTITKEWVNVLLSPESSII